DVDQGYRSQVFRLTDRHTLTNHALSTAQADTQLVLDQFANGLDATVAQVVDVVRFSHAIVDLDHALDELNQIIFSDGAHRARDLCIHAQTLVQLITAHALQIIAALVEKLAFQVNAGVIQS